MALRLCILPRPRVMERVADGSPSGRTGAAIEPRQLESCDPTQIPAREKTKVSQLPLPSLDTVWGIFGR